MDGYGRDGRLSRTETRVYMQELLRPFSSVCEATRGRIVADCETKLCVVLKVFRALNRDDKPMFRQIHPELEWCLPSKDPTHAQQIG